MRYNSTVSIKSFFAWKIFKVLILALTVFKIFTLRKKIPDTFVYSLTYDQTLRTSTPKELQNFISEVRFKPYFEAKNVIWEVRSFRLQRLIAKNFVYDISLYLYFYCLNWSNTLRILRYMYEKSGKMYELGTCDFREMKRYSLDREVWRLIEKQHQGSLTILTTQSQLKSLPEPFVDRTLSKVNRGMLWYSANSTPILNKFDISKGQSEFTLFTDDSLDFHLVWNLNQVEYLHLLGIQKAYAIGSLVFQPQVKSSILNKIDRTFKILIFDVTPIVTLEAVNLYSTSFVKRNVQHIVDTCTSVADEKNMKIEIQLKQKRRMRKAFHSPEYIQFLDSLKRQKKLKLVSWSANLYKLIDDASLVFGVPYTSPVQIAFEMGVPSCYSGLEADEWLLEDIHEGVPVIKDYEKLLEFVRVSMLTGGASSKNLSS